MVWLDHSGHAGGRPSRQTQARPPPHRRQAGDSGWAGSPRFGPIWPRLGSSFPSLVGRASERAGREALHKHTVFFFEAYERLSMS